MATNCLNCSDRMESLKNVNLWMLKTVSHLLMCTGSSLVRSTMPGVAIGSTFVLLTVVLLLMFICKKRAWEIFKTPNLGNNPTMEDERNAKQFIKNYQSALLTNYSCNDIKKMMNGFKEILRKGGYGNVLQIRNSIQNENYNRLTYTNQKHKNKKKFVLRL